MTGYHSVGLGLCIASSMEKMNLEKLEKQFGLIFSLSNKEKIGVKIAPRGVEGALVGFHYSLIAEVFTIKEVNDHAFIDQFTPLWRGKEGVSIRALGGARFIARFIGKKDMLRVLEMDKPWVFRDDMVLVVDGSHEGRASDAPLFLVTIWVQLNNVLPLSMIDKDDGHDYIGRFLRVKTLM